MLPQQGQRHINACQKGRTPLRGHHPSAHMTDRHQRCFWKPQLTAAEIQSLSLPVRQRPLDRGRDFVTHLFALAMPLDQTCVAQNTEMMGGMGLRAFQLLHKIRHTFFIDEQGFQDTQPRFVAHGFENRGALARSQHLAGRRGFHHQQLPWSEELVTASPPTL